MEDDTNGTKTKTRCSINCTPNKTTRSPKRSDYRTTTNTPPLNRPTLCCTTQHGPPLYATPRATQPTSIKSLNGR